MNTREAAEFIADGRFEFTVEVGHEVEPHVTDIARGYLSHLEADAQRNRLAEQESTELHFGLADWTLLGGLLGALIWAGWVLFRFD